MNSVRRHGIRVSRGIVIGIAYIGIPFLTAAAREVSGRVTLTYQNVDGTRNDAEFFNQNLETTFRDRLFYKNDLRISMYFNNAENLRGNLTTRRYYGRFELTGQYYNFYALYSPKQKITPLEIEQSRELTENQYVLTVTVPSFPQIRLYYAKRRRFADNELIGFNRNLRGELQYTYKFVEVGLNRWYEKNENGTDNKTVVTGGNIRLRKGFSHSININSGYEYLLNESFTRLGIKQNVSNHTVSTLVSGGYRKYVSSSFSLVSRFLDTDIGKGSESRNHTIAWYTTLFPNYWVKADLSRSYIYERQDTTRSISDYATAQVVFSGDLLEKTRGRAQIARRFVIKDDHGAIPSNIFFFTVNSELYPGLNARADLNISQRDVDQLAGNSNKFQINSLFEVHANPRRNLFLSTDLQYYNLSDNLSFLKNDRTSYGLKTTYSPAGHFHIGLDAQRHEITSGSAQTSNSLSLNSSMQWREKTSFNITYGMNTLQTQAEDDPDAEERVLRRTLNMQGQVWVTRKGVLAVNYSKQLSDEEDNGGRFLTLSFRYDL